VNPNDELPCDEMLAEMLALPLEEVMCLSDAEKRKMLDDLEFGREEDYDPWADEPPFDTAPGASEPSKPAETDFDIVISELARLSPLEFDRVRKDQAGQLGVRAATLDHEVKKARKSDVNEVNTQAHWSVEPWREPVKPGEVLARIKGRLMCHVVMSEASLLTASLWVMFAWVHDAAVHSPILLVSSPEAECGKTTLLGLIRLLAPKGCLIVEVSPAVLYRMIEKWRPCLIVDEADVAFKNNPELRAVINAGWTRGTGVPRCHPETHEPEFFETFGPKAIGLKGLRVPDTTLSRSIIIDMQRKLPGDTADSFAHMDDDNLARTRQRLARFAADYSEKLADCSPHMPDGFTNRLEANWKVLLAISDLCGVGSEARKAAEAVSRRSDEASLGVELLRDIREIYKSKRVDRLRSEALVSALVDKGDRPWAELPYTNKAMTQLQLAKMLKPYKVRPSSVKFEHDLTFKGYLLDWFDDAFRYIPATATGGYESSLASQNSRNPGTLADSCEKSRNPERNYPASVPSQTRNNQAPVPAPVLEEMADFCESSGVPGSGSTRERENDDNDPFWSLKDPSLGHQPKRKH
jgi:putative DNA primase/helicase